MQVVAHNEELEGNIWVFIDEEVTYNIVEVHGKCDYKVSEVLSWLEFLLYFSLSYL